MAGAAGCLGAVPGRRRGADHRPEPGAGHLLAAGSRECSGAGSGGGGPRLAVPDARGAGRDTGYAQSPAADAVAGGGAGGGGICAALAAGAADSRAVLGRAGLPPAHYPPVGAAGVRPLGHAAGAGLGHHQLPRQRQHHLQRFPQGGRVNGLPQRLRDRQRALRPGGRPVVPAPGDAGDRLPGRGHGRLARGGAVRRGGLPAHSRLPAAGGDHLQRPRLRGRGDCGGGPHGVGGAAPAKGGGRAVAAARAGLGSVPGAGRRRQRDGPGGRRVERGPGGPERVGGQAAGNITVSPAAGGAGRSGAGRELLAAAQLDPHRQSPLPRAGGGGGSCAVPGLRAGVLPVHRIPRAGGDAPVARAGALCVLLAGRPGGVAGGDRPAGLAADRTDLGVAAGLRAGGGPAAGTPPALAAGAGAGDGPRGWPWPWSCRSS